MASDLVTAFTVAGFPAIADGLVAAGYEPPPPTALEPIRPSGGDDTAMLQAAADEASARGGDGLYGAAPARGTLRLDGRFRLSDTLVIRDCNVDAAGATLVFPPDIPVCVDIGTEAFSADRRRMVMPSLTRLPIGGESPRLVPDTVGLRIVAADGCDISVGGVWHSDEGLVLEADGQGVAYNTFTIKRLVANRPLVLRSMNGGWSNQNTFIGGSYQPWPNEGVAVPITIEDGNNNVWLNPSVEGFDLEWMIDIGGSMGLFLNPRFESGANPGRVRFREGANQNLIVGGYNTERVVFVEDGANPWHGLRRNGVVTANSVRVGAPL